jgi:Ca-activated chloride channel family protein
VTLPLLGPLGLTGFKNPWFFLFLLIVVAVVGLYIVVQIARERSVSCASPIWNCSRLSRRYRDHAGATCPPYWLCFLLRCSRIAMAGPTNDVRIPRNRAVVMLVIDVSQSMKATDVAPSRLVAAQEAAKQFADQLTSGINLGLIDYAGTATVLVSPTTNRDAAKLAIDKLQLADRTATGEAISTALQAIATVGAVIGGGDAPPPARIVLMSDGKETVPSNPDNPKGAYTAARTAKDQGCRYRQSPSERRTAPSPSTVRSSRSPSTMKCSSTSPTFPAATPTPRPAWNSSSRCSPPYSSRSATRPSKVTPAWVGYGLARSSWLWGRWRHC